MLRGIVCKVRGHVVNRHRVWHDNLNYRTTCQHCGAALLRTGEGWRAFDSKKDANVERWPHPDFNNTKPKSSKDPVGGSRRPR
tara:strand:- start:1422 stop:1670 length:249 start_codon:yes stop_codon:yes gene_type:complete